MRGKARSTTYTLRFILVLGILTLFGMTIIGRLFLLQVVRGNYFSALGQGQSKTYEDVKPRRGDIVFRTRTREGGESFIVATDKEWQGAYLIPQKITDPDRVVKELSSLLGIDSTTLAEKVNKQDDPYEPLGEKIDDEVIERIKTLNLEGVKISTRMLRSYPYNSLASHLLGFVGFSGDEQSGTYGLEKHYDDILKGSSGAMEVERGLGAETLVFMKRLLRPVQDGATLITTIDYNIQSKAEELLGGLMEEWNADGGSIVVADPSTGGILAMASSPTFDLNYYNKVEDATTYLNPVTQKIFEPGSVFKPITMAAALNEGLIGPETTYVDEGEVKFGRYTIQNSDLKNHGTQTMTQVLEKSLNTGAIFVQELLGKERFKEYVERFGFGERTGINVPGELGGNILNLSSGRDINFATASFGQGIAVTPIELIAAFSAIANQGKMMRPHMVDTIIHPDGKEETVEPEIIREVITPQTASRLTAMMVSVVKNGHSKRAGVPGYLVAGKTGTAQIPQENERGYSDKTTHSFIGFAPAFNPKFIILIKLDNPIGVRFAEASIAPAFSKLAEYILTYYEIPPQ